MSRETERLLLLSHAKSFWLPAWGPVSWPNADFSPPANARWASLRLMEYGSERINIGRPKKQRHYGSVQIDLYSPKNTGTKEAREITDAIEAIYDELILRTADGEPVEFQTPASHDLSGSGSEDGTADSWYRRVVDSPFYRTS
jgi:hypothetical protein